MVGSVHDVPIEFGRCRPLDVVARPPLPLRRESLAPVERGLGDKGLEEGASAGIELLIRQPRVFETKAARIFDERRPIQCKASEIQPAEAIRLRALASKVVRGRPDKACRVYDNRGGGGLPRHLPARRLRRIASRSGRLEPEGRGSDRAIPQHRPSPGTLGRPQSRHERPRTVRSGSSRGTPGRVPSWRSRPDIEAAQG